jgi:hypothetical protein
LSWLQHLDTNNNINNNNSKSGDTSPRSGEQRFEDLRVAASMHVAPMLKSRGFVGVEDLDLNLRRNICSDDGGSSRLGIPSHRPSLSLAIECYRGLLASSDSHSPSVGTLRGPFYEGQATAEAILDLLQAQQPPPLPSSTNTEQPLPPQQDDPWAEINIF